MKSSNYSGLNFSKANSARRAATHCKNGHPFSGDNLRLCPDGRRKCQTCIIEFNKRRKFAGSKYLAKDFAKEMTAEIRAKKLPIIAESVYELSKRLELPGKNTGLSQAEWMKLYGIKPKRVLVIDDGVDDE